jgi:hypothetical protein
MMGAALLIAALAVTCPGRSERGKPSTATPIRSVATTRLMAGYAKACAMTGSFLV